MPADKSRGRQRRGTTAPTERSPSWPHLAQWLTSRDGASSGKADALFGAASTTLEAIYGLYPVQPTACSTSSRGLRAAAECPCCGATWLFDATRKTDKKGQKQLEFSASPRGWRRLSPMRLELRKRSDTLQPPTRTFVACEFDDAAYSGFWLAETFRGSPGRALLLGWLCHLGLARKNDTIRELLTYPEAAGGRGTGRPTILARTGRRTVAIVHQPPRGGNERLATHHIARCRKLLRHPPASALSGPPALVMLLREGSAAQKQAAKDDRLIVATWTDLLDCLAAESTGKAARHRIDFMRAGATGARFTDHPIWSEGTYADKHPHNFEWVVFPYRNNLTTVGHVPSTLVCDGCGHTMDLSSIDLDQPAPLRFVSAKGSYTAAPRAHVYTKHCPTARERRRDDENAQFLDLLAELVADPPLASATMDLLGVPVGKVEHILCWPRLRASPRKPKPAFTPDAVVIGRECVVVVEAKRRAFKKVKQPTLPRQEIRELLVRCVQALDLRHQAEKQLGTKPRARVLLVSDIAEHPDIDRLPDIVSKVWQELVEQDHAIWHWADTSKKILAADDPLCRELRRLGCDGTRELVEIRSWRACLDALARAALQLDGGDDALLALQRRATWLRDRGG